jgi:hypothetical protein
MTDTKDEVNPTSGLTEEQADEQLAAIQRTMSGLPADEDEAKKVLAEQAKAGKEAEKAEAKEAPRASAAK